MYWSEAFCSMFMGFIILKEIMRLERRTAKKISAIVRVREFFVLFEKITVSSTGMERRSTIFSWLYPAGIARYIILRPSVELMCMDFPSRPESACWTSFLSEWFCIVLMFAKESAIIVPSGLISVILYKGLL